MKRRIYWDRESGPIDATTQWSLWGMDYWNEEPDVLSVLDNDELWNEYQEAAAKLHEIERRMHEACKQTPWTEDELRLGREATALLRKEYDYDRVEEIEAELLANANKRDE